jgi:hypothetical protein
MRFSVPVAKAVKAGASKTVQPALTKSGAQTLLSSFVAKGEPGSFPNQAESYTN